MPARTADEYFSTIRAARGERRSPSTGLPILSTAPLSPAEHDALRLAARTLRVIADRFDDARDADRVTWALQAAELHAEASVAIATVAAGLGSHR